MMKNRDKRPETKPAAGEKQRSSLKIKHIFVRPDGVLRAVWKLVCALFIYRFAAYAVRLSLGAAFAGLFSAWRVDRTNIHMAPAWARGIFSWHTSLITVAVSIVTVAVTLLLARWWPGRKNARQPRTRGALLPAMLGLGTALVSSALFLLTDSMRTEWPLSEPAVSVSVLVMLPITLFTTFAEELFTKRVVFEGLDADKGCMRAFFLTAAVFFLFNGGYAGTVISGLNVFLMGLVCCMLYADRGLWAATLFRGLWSYAVVFITGVGASGAVQPVYRLYRVSDVLLTGGDSGMIFGTWMTFLLVCMLAWMRRQHVRAVCVNVVCRFKHVAKKDSTSDR